jgi:amidohydrolase
MPLTWLSSPSPLPPLPLPTPRSAPPPTTLAPASVETRRDIHRHPELGNREFRTGKLVSERLQALGLEVRYPGREDGPWSGS